MYNNSMPFVFRDCVCLMMNHYNVTREAGLRTVSAHRLVVKPQTLEVGAFH
jgi:hypothetical protein